MGWQAFDTINNKPLIFEKRRKTHMKCIELQQSTSNKLKRLSNTTLKVKIN